SPRWQQQSKKKKKHNQPLKSKPRKKNRNTTKASNSKAKPSWGATNWPCQGVNHANHCSASAMPPSSKGANNHTGAPNANSSANGTTHQANTGISTKLAKGDNTPQLPNHQAPIAPRANDNSHCARHQMPLTPTRNSNNKAPMAKKDIQKLGSNTLKGCHNNTSTQATLKPDVKPPCCPRHTLNIITAAIITARCVGKENPANPAYSKAANKAGQSAKPDAVCNARTTPTQHQRPIIHTSPATRLTCSPEIDIKCAVPLSRYWRHCSSSSQRRYATTS